MNRVGVESHSSQLESKVRLELGKLPACLTRAEPREFALHKTGLEGNLSESRGRRERERKRGLSDLKIDQKSLLSKLASDQPSIGKEIPSKLNCDHKP